MKQVAEMERLFGRWRSHPAADLGLLLRASVRLPHPREPAHRTAEGLPSSRTCGARGWSILESMACGFITGWRFRRAVPVFCGFVPQQPFGGTRLPSLGCRQKDASSRKKTGCLSAGTGEGSAVFYPYDGLRSFTCTGIPIIGLQRGAATGGTSTRTGSELENRSL